MSVQRPCKCQCGRTFTVDPRRPGREYCYGHKPANAKPTPSPREALRRAQSHGRSEEERHTLDYKLALQTARRELSLIAQQIDAADDLIADLRKDLHSREAQKEALTDRHLTIDATIMALDALIEGKSLAREIAAAEVKESQ